MDNTLHYRSRLEPVSRPIPDCPVRVRDLVQGSTPRPLGRPWQYVPAMLRDLARHSGLHLSIVDRCRPASFLPSSSITARAASADGREYFDNSQLHAE